MSRSPRRRIVSIALALASLSMFAMTNVVAAGGCNVPSCKIGG